MVTESIDRVGSSGYLKRNFAEIPGMGRVKSRIRHDYKPGWRRPGSRQDRLHRFAVPGATAFGVGLVLYAIFGLNPEPSDTPEPAADAPSAETAAGETGLQRKALVLPPAPGAGSDAQAPQAAPTPTAGPAEPAKDGGAAARKAPAPEPATETATVAASAAESAAVEQPPSVVVADAPLGEAITLTVRKGDSLDSMFRRNKLSVADLARMMKIKEAKNSLRKIRPGDEIEVVRDGEHVLALTRRLDETVSLQVLADGEGYRTEFLTHPVERRQQAAHGQIESSLFLAGAAEGLSDTLIMNFAGIFAWDVDFALEVRQNDSFSLVYEEVWQDGRKIRDGDILAAEFVNQGEIFRAVRFENPEGKADYYTPEGRSVRKAFLRAPLDFRRVSSNFNPNRLHPILKTKRPHRGVDYAASRGTPVKAAGDGRIIHRGRKGGYGNTVIIQHGGNVTTLYAHLSKFRKGQKNGSRVKQGQVIGYVGATGLATAPHLHYEYRLNGVHRNPRTVPLPAADPVPAAYREQFAEATRPLLETLDTISPTRLAAGPETLAANDRQPAMESP
jgi:murein DD-endopeptidase MepM/ murein hydrolase activator NlpD